MTAVDRLAVEVGEGDTVGVGDDEVEHRPAQRQADRLAGEAANHLGPPPTSPSERSSRFVLLHGGGGAGIAQVNQERVEVVGEAGGRRGEGSRLRAPGRARDLGPPPARARLKQYLLIEPVALKFVQ